MSTDDPFRLLGLPRRFSLSEAELSAALRKAGMAWHPDRFAMASPAERDEAEQRMADLNHAYEQLADPLARIAQLFGFGAEQYSASPAFLMEMMELREELASAEKAGQADQAAALLTQLEKAYQERLEKLGQAAEQASQDQAKPANLAALGVLFTEATYLRRNREELARHSRPTT